jgi:hypothetical protein
MSQILRKGYIDKKEKGSGEYQKLYLEGIELLQDLSGANWTDYNEHDPGVTIFENIAYTLTNLSHKVDQSIEDILIESKNKAYDIKFKDSFLGTNKRSQLKPIPLKSGDNGFFVASEILTTNPVIIEDYRKMFVDSIHNTKNVWIKTHNQKQSSNGQTNMNIRGLYHIFVEMYDYHEDKAVRAIEENRIIKKVKQLFHAQRNLCEDIYQVTILQPFLLDLKLELTIDVTADGEEVFAQVYYDVNDYLTHEARFQSLWELREEEDQDFNAIYLGPTLAHGFMKDEELQPRKNEIYISEITKIISKVAGVVRIDKFEIKENYENKKPAEYVIKVPASQSPRLEIPESNEKLSFRTADITLKPDVREIKKRYVSIEAEYYGAFKTVSKAANFAEIPQGESLGISSFYSIREQFPAIYGIGKFGLPKSASNKRKAQVKQLKAYLLPFDQLMANFLEQLTHLYTLYDVNNSGVQTYFCQELEDMEGLQELIKVDPKNQKEPLDQWSDVLKALNSRFDANGVRRLNEVADNLLARYAEEFPTYVLQKINTSCFGKHFTDEDFDKKLLSWKRKLVANYGRLSYNRAKSFNYTVKPESEGPITIHNTTATIVEKISILLGIYHSETRNLSALVDHTRMTPKLILEEDFIFLKDDEILVVEKLIKGIKDRVELTGESEVRVNDILSLGVVQSNYQVEQEGKGSKTYNVILKKDKQPENNIQLMSGLAKKDVEKAQSHALNFLKKMNDKSEGIHLIEHLLLAPPVRGYHFGFSFKLKLSTTETLEFKQTKLLDNHNRNRFVDSLKSQMEEGQGLKFNRTGEQGSFGIEIYKTENKPLAISTRRFVTIKEVEDRISMLEKVGETQGSFEILNQKYCAYYDKEETKKVDEAFFSFRMSFVLPSWPVRFQAASFKKQFSNILYQHAPIHIQYQTYWLGLPKLRDFEETYFAWLEKLSDEKMTEKRMSIAYDLVEKIKKLHKYTDN